MSRMHFCGAAVCFYCHNYDKRRFPYKLFSEIAQVSNLLACSVFLIKEEEARGEQREGGMQGGDRERRRSPMTCSDINS